MSVSTFMRTCLTHPLGGYYMFKDVFGTKGDFTTSPEMLQSFGEMIGLWFISQFQSVKPPQIRLVELGPGKGTLMSDVLRTWTQFPFMKSAIQSVHLVEASHHLKELQKEKLSTYSTSIPIQWHDYVEEIPKGPFTFYLAHEFLDALPVYKFHKTESGWREILVDVDESQDSPFHFRFVLSPSHTKASVTLLNEEKFKNSQIGDQIEISPEVARLSRQLAFNIKRDGGCSLLIDYGHDHCIDNSLRAIQNHEFKPIFYKPGESDLSCDVDFSLVKDSCKDLVHTHGPLTQRDFFLQLGIGHRMAILLQNTTCLELKKEMCMAMDRLFGEKDTEMGNVYKCMALTSYESVPFPFVGNKSC